MLCMWCGARVNKPQDKSESSRCKICNRYGLVSLRLARQIGQRFIREVEYQKEKKAIASKKNGPLKKKVIRRAAFRP